MPERLVCPACSSHGVRPSKQQLLFDRLYRIFGREPYDCLWCRKRCFLVAPDKSPDLQQADLQQADLHEADLHEAVLQQADLHEAVLQEADLQEAVRDGLPPKSTPVPSPVVPVPSDVPDAPMYAEKGRLRLSEMTLEQIKWRGEHFRYAAAVVDVIDPSNTERPKS